MATASDSAKAFDAELTVRKLLAEAEQGGRGSPQALRAVSKLRQSEASDPELRSAIESLLADPEYGYFRQDYLELLDLGELSQPS